VGRLASRPSLAGRIGLGVRASASFQIFGLLGSGPRLVGRISSGVQVRTSYLLIYLLTYLLCLMMDIPED